MARPPLVKRLTALALALGLAAAPAAAQAPIPGSGGWLLFEHLPGVEQRACMARMGRSSEAGADVMMFLNNDRVPILTAGRPDWHELLGPAEIGLSIDGAPPVTLHAQMFNNLVMVMPDNGLLQRLRGARNLDWTFPFGRFSADVSGLGTALDAISACAAAGGTPSAPGA